MKSECPQCDTDLYGERLKLVYTYFIDIHDADSGQQRTVKRNEYQCPFCLGIIMVTGGHIIAVQPESSE